MQKRVYTKQDLNDMRQTFVEFDYDTLDQLQIKRKVNNSTYKSDTLTLTIRQHQQSFILRLPTIRLVCLKSVMILALRHHKDPIEIMMRVHNYGVYGHKHINTTNERLSLEVASTLVSDKNRESRRQKILYETAGELE